MTARELHSLLESAEPPLLVHVLPADVFAAQRIPGSRSACIYEVAFPEHIAVIAADTARPLVVYGAGTGSLDAAVAVEKLAALGYSNVSAFPGGLEEWHAAGLPLEGDGPLPAPPVLDGRYVVDTDASLIRWTGRNLFNHHHGTVRLAGGEIILRQNQLVSARFRIDMHSIDCEDIADSALNRQLLDHLHSTDFFDLARHREAEFVAVAADPLPHATDGTPNHLLRGQFTLRGITRELAFPILVATADGRRLTAQGLLDLDRTQFDSTYGSGRLFRFLGPHLVNDHIHLHVKLHADLQT
jgi:polyisoprenoid-binding protein YceI